MAVLKVKILVGYWEVQMEFYLVVAKVVLSDNDLDKCLADERVASMVATTVY
jgi:hypothetical protein